MEDDLGSNYVALNSRTNSGNLQSVQMAFEWSQKSRTICMRPCWAVTVFRSFGVGAVPNNRCRARV